MEGIITGTLPDYPKETGNSVADSAAKHAYFHKLAGTSEPRENLTPPIAFQSAATASAIAQKANTYAKEVTAEAAPAATVDNVAEFDRELRLKGMQVGVEVDQTAKAYLENVFRTTPEAERTTKWRATYERDLAQVFEGRRMGETPQAFAARKAAASSQPAAVTPTAVAPNAPAAEVPAPTADLEAAIGALDRVIDDNGFADVKHFHKELLSGYTLPTYLKGQTYSAEETISQLAIARKAGITQEQVNAFIHQQMKTDGLI